MSEILNNIITLSDEKRELLELLLRKQGIDVTRSVMTRTRRDTDTFPLSFAQQRLWFLSQLEPDSPAYNIPLAIRIKGKCDSSLLERAFREIVQRHEILRTRFAVVGSEPAQIIQPSTQFSLQNIDLTAYSVAERELRAHEFIATEARRPFDLSCLPLMRVSLLNIDQDENILLIVMHHILADGWSMGVLVNEVRTLYEALATGNPSPLPPLLVQYADFAAWQRRWLTGETLEKQLGYWKSRLADAPSLLPLPTDRPRTAMLKSSGSHIGFEIPSKVSEKLKPLLQHEGVTLYMILLAAFNVLLHRFTAQQDISVGTPIANRNRKETEGLIGFFVNTLVMRTDLSGNPTFLELLHRVRDFVLGAYDHQDIPFEMLVDELHIHRDLSYTPLFQVMFDVVETSSKSSQMHGLELSFPEIETGVAKFDLMLEMSANAGVLKGEFEYNTELFDEATIEQFAESFTTLLEAIVSRPSLRIGDLQIMSDEASHKILVEWNSTAHVLPASSLMELFEAQVGRSADAIAVRQGDVQLSYRELNSRANQLAHHLIQEGVAPESIVGLCIDRSVGMLVAMLGILKAGGAYLPLDPAYPAERIAFMCSDSGVKIVIAEARNTHLFADSDARILLLDQLQEHLASSEVSNPLHVADDDSLAYVIYTSGSTGMPKGVLITRRSVINHNMSVTRAFGLTSTDHVLQFASLNFDAAVEEILPTLLCGATLVLRNADVPSCTELLQMVRNESLTVLDLPTAYWSEWVYELSQANMEVPESVRLVIVGGERVPPERYAQWKKSCRNVRWLNTYGPTETTIISTLYDATGDPKERWDVPIGHPISNSQAYVLDEHLNHVPIGVEGELYIGGMGIARGYLNRPAITAERFVPDPFAATAGSRMYRTGDQVRYLPDGNLLYVGRRDQQVKLRGFRVEVGEIEAALSNYTHVREAVVEVKEDSSGEKRLVAFCVPAGKDELTPTLLREHLRTQLPEYMIPAVFVTTESLPHTPSGKIDRKALIAPEQSTLSEARNRQLPRSPMEEIIASIWSELLHLERVTIEENFFELGGHSLLATRLVSRIRQVLHLDLPLRVIFESPTVAALAAVVEKALENQSAVAAPPIVPVPRTQEIPLSFAQQRLWFLDQLEPGTAQYNIPAGLRISGMLNEGLLILCLNEIVRRHEVLRTTFQTVDGTPVQVIAPSLTLALRHKDLTSRPIETREQEAERLTREEATIPFSLSEGPLVRVLVIRLEEETHFLVFTIHHIISDGWSTSVLIRELAALYRAFSNNEPSPLPPLKVQYADIAVWQRTWLQGEVLENELEYWKKELQDAPSSLPLPADRPRPAMQTERGAVYPFTLSKEIGNAIKRVNKQEGVTTFMTLLAAFQTLLYRYTGEQDICVGTPIANRNRVETEGLIGFFINTLVMRGDLSGNPTFNALLARVRETALGAYAHQDMPFEKVVGTVAADRNMSHTPLFQVMFVLQNTPYEPLELPGLTMTEVPIDTGIALFDLTLVMEESAEGVTGGIEYNTDLFDESTIERMSRHFTILLESLLNDPTQKIGSVPVLLQEEKKQLSAVNATEARIPQCTLITLFEEQVGRTPNAVAVKSASQQLTYAELNQRANQLAHYLQRQGVGPDIPVGLCLNRSLEMLVGMLGILKAGGAYVPLDPLYPLERLAFMCADAGIQQLVTQRAHAGLFAANDIAIISLDVLHNDLGAEPTFNPICIAQPENLAYIIYTSGSTGTPKGVEIEHRSVINHNLAAQQEFALTARDRVLQFASLNFDAAVEEIFPTLFTGATLVLRSETVPSGDELLALINAEQLTVLDLPTAYWSEWLYEMTLSKVTLPASLRLVVVGGERVAPERYAEWQRIVPQVRWLNTYGPTETTIISTLYEGTPSKLADVPIGRPIANTQAYVLDEFLQPAPMGVVGELCTGGMCVARGYHRRPDATAERFVPDPFSALPGARMYRTGDQVKYKDGMLYYIGRRDQQVKVRGFRVEVGEVESVLQKHPQIREAVVVVTGTIEKRLVGYYVPTDDVTIKPGDLRAYVRHELPEYMVPAVFIPVDSVPRTPSGKIDRTALPVPQSQREISETVLPRTETEQRLTEIWQRVLGVETVGTGDNFFELGGDSILSIQVIARANHIGIHLTPKQLFQSPTIAQLAAVAGTAAAIQAEQGVVTGPVPLTPIQRWFFEQDFANPHHWNQSVMLEVKERLDRNLLEQAVRHLMNHHDALRMRFTKTENGWEQYNSGVVDAVPVHWIDLSATDKNERPAVLEQHAHELQRSLDITHGPIIRVGYFHAGPGDTDRLLIIIHHLVVDGVSWRILVEDLETLYTQLKGGKPLSLPPKTTSFKEWGLKLQEYATTDQIRLEAKFWQRFILAHTTSPNDSESLDVEASAEAAHSVFGNELTGRLMHDLTNVFNVRFEEILVAAFFVGYTRWSGKRSVWIDWEGHGRDEILESVDMSRTIGWFTRVCPLRLNLGSAITAGDALGEVKEQMRAIPNNGIGYGLLRYLQDGSRQPIDWQAFPKPKISFNYLGQFDAAIDLSSPFAIATESRGNERGPDGKQTHQLDVTAVLHEGNLNVEIAYGRSIYTRESIELLLASVKEAVNQIVATLQEPDAKKYSPSDFPMAELGSEELANVLAKITFTTT